MISVFIPAYNEGRIIEDSVRRVIDALGGLDFELFVVDDGSTDDTPALASKLSALDGRVRLVRYDGGPSRRENLARSFSLARGDVIAFIDADLSAGPEYLPVMVGRLADWDIVVGSRSISGSEAVRRVWRLVFSRVAGAFTRVWLGSRISDHQCGLKVFKRDVILKLAGEAGFDSSGWRGFGWDTEVLVRAQRRGYRVLEMPVRWEESQRSSVTVFRDWRVVPYMLALRFRL
jgi:glycosyltransferase AglD